MRLEITRVLDPETNEVHACWLWGRETLCGLQKTYWERTEWRAPIECDDCTAVFMGAAVMEAASYLGRRMKDPKKVKT